MTYIEAQGAALKELRKRKRLTIVEVTNKMNKTVQWLSAIELGKRNLYFDDAKALCKIYDATLDDLSILIDKYNPINKWDIINVTNSSNMILN